MAKSAEIFTLIRSLTMPEKRFFKVYWDRKSKEPSEDSGSDNYICIELFDDLLAFKGDSEEEFVRLNAAKRYASKISYNKHRLQEMVVESCLNMTQHSVDHELGQLLDQARFLRNRRLTKSSLKKLNKAQALAERYEKHELLLEVLRLKRTHYMEMKGNSGKEVLEIVANLVKVGKVVENKNRYLFIKDTLFIEQKKQARERKAEQLEALKKLMEDPMMQDDQLPESFDAKHSYYFAKAIYYQLSGDWEYALSFHTMIFNLWKDAPFIREDRPNHFKNAVINYLNLCCSRDNYDHFEEALAYLEDPNHHSEHDRIDALQNALFIKLTHAINKCMWPNATEVIERYEKNRTAIETKNHTSRTMSFYLNFAWCEFVMQRYKEAADWIDRILDLGKKEVRGDLKNFGLLFKPIIRIEQGETDSLYESDLNAAQRHLRKSQSLFPFERAVLKFLTHFTKFSREQEEEEAKSLKLQVEALEKAESDQNAFGIEIVLRWLESRIRRMDLRAVVEEKWLNS